MNRNLNHIYREISRQEITTVNSIQNGGFETNTFSGWGTIGDTSIETDELGVSPSEGNFQALIKTGASDSGNSVRDSDLEEFLDLTPGVLDLLGNGDVTEGSAIKQTFTADAGDILTLDWNFLTNQATPNETFNDFAFVSLTPLTLELADTTSPLFVETLVPDFSEETGYETISIGIAESGTYTLSFGVVDVGDETVDSGLLVDNVEISTGMDFEFDIEINFTDDSFTPSQQAVFEDAASRWEEIIIADLPEVFVPGFGLVDDIVIDASAFFIDGPLSILAQAGPTVLRSDSFLPARGIMEFDSADLEFLEEEGLLDAVILHEIAHALGLGTIWEDLDLLTDVGSPDPRFVGAGATAEYNDIFGVNELSVPVEADFGPGTALSHWDEEVFDNELMTGFINFGENPLSRITAASMGDLGYEVNVDAADAYTPPGIGIVPSETVGWITAMDLEVDFVNPIVGHDIALDINPEFV